MKTTQLLRLISIINSLFIIPACSAQNPSENLMEEVLEDLSVNNDINKKRLKMTSRKLLRHQDDYCIPCP